MKVLSRAALAEIDVAHASPSPRPIEILQIGEGVFLRGFVDWMVDVANEKGVFGGGVAVAAPWRHQRPPPLLDQDCLYTVLLRARAGGVDVAERRVVTAVQTALDPYTQWDAVKELAASRALKFVVSNTTEAGIADVQERYDPDLCPTSFPAKAAALLKARYEALGSEAPGLVFLPCELIEANGATLRRIVLDHARRWGFGAAFTDWVARKNRFLDTLVDRIVAGYPAAEAEALFAAWGYRDPLAVVAEPFHLWVIEGPQEIAAELPLAEAGLNVIVTDNLKPYRDRKLRILNGAHTATALAAYLAGLDTVEEMVADPLLSRYLRKLLFDEIVPEVRLPDAERRAYAESVLERFGNPFIRHELIAITLNSVSKWRVRILPTVKDALARGADAPSCLAFSLAALLWFYRGRIEGDAYLGSRAKGDYPIRDDSQILGIMADAWADAEPGAAGETAMRLLADARLWGEKLTALGSLGAQTRAAIEAIERSGVRAAIEGLLARPA